MSIKKSIHGEIFFPKTTPQHAMSVSDITKIEIIPECKKNKEGMYLVRDETGDSCILENPEVLSDGRTKGLIVKVRGLHTGLRKGERINVQYTTDSARVHWCDYYEILGKKNLLCFRFN